MLRMMHNMLEELSLLTIHNPHLVPVGYTAFFYLCVINYADDIATLLQLKHMQLQCLQCRKGMWACAHCHPLSTSAHVPYFIAASQRVSAPAAFGRLRPSL